MSRQTKAQLRKMDDATLLHVIKVSERLVSEPGSKAANDTATKAHAEAKAEWQRRVAADGVL